MWHVASRKKKSATRSIQYFRAILSSSWLPFCSWIVEKLTNKWKTRLELLILCSCNVFMPAAMCFVYWRRIWWYWNSDYILSFEGEKMKKKNSTHIFFVSVLLHSFLFIKFCFPLFEHIFTIQKHGERKYDGWIKMSHRIRHN